jgi:hypothetical protein
MCDVAPESRYQMLVWLLVAVSATLLLTATSACMGVLSFMLTVIDGNCGLLEVPDLTVTLDIGVSGLEAICTGGVSAWINMLRSLGCCLLVMWGVMVS